VLVNLNDSVIARLPRPAKGTRYEVRDKKQAGLILRVGTCRKSFYWRTRVNCQYVKVHLGEYGHTTIEQARLEVLKLILQSREGTLPPSLRQQKNKQKQAPTLLQIFEQYLSMRKLRDTSKETYRKIMRLYLQDLAILPVTQITSNDCYKLYCKLRDGKSPAKANSVLQLLDSLVRYAGIIHEVEVCQVKAKVKAAGLLIATPARDSRIKESELGIWFASLAARPVHYRVMLLTTLLTGFRRSEISKLTWNDFDPISNTLLARDTKNHQNHLLQIGPKLSEVLKVFHAHTDAEVIFSNRVDRWAALASSQGGVNFSMHTLRRTFATIVAKVTKSPIIVKQLMNHSCQGDVTMYNYIRTEENDLRTAMAAIEDFVIETAPINFHDFLPELFSPPFN
jgi:integrase